MPITNVFPTEKKFILVNMFIVQLYQSEKMFKQSQMRVNTVNRKESVDSILILSLDIRQIMPPYITL